MSTRPTLVTLALKLEEMRACKSGMCMHCIDLLVLEIQPLVTKLLTTEGQCPRHGYVDTSHRCATYDGQPLTLPKLTPANKDLCEHCKGSGFESDSHTPCTWCGGDGWMPAPDAGGEWELGPPIHHGGIEQREVRRKGRDSFNGGHVCTAAVEDATRIVSDHNASQHRGLGAGEEWQFIVDTSGGYAVCDSAGKPVAYGTTARNARQIISDHTLAASVPKLREALEMARQDRIELVGKCAHEEVFAETCPQCQIDAALAATQTDSGEGK